MKRLLREPAPMIQKVYDTIISETLNTALQSDVYSKLDSLMKQYDRRMIPRTEFYRKLHDIRESFCDTYWIDIVMNRWKEYPDLNRIEDNQNYFRPGDENELFDYKSYNDHDWKQYVDEQIYEKIDSYINSFMLKHRNVIEQQNSTNN